VIETRLDDRPKWALTAPADYENRAMDLAIEALLDVKECDGACLSVKWDRVFAHPSQNSDGVSQTRSDTFGAVAPILYVLFDPKVSANMAALPRLHVNKFGQLAPAHAICLAKMPSGTLLEGQALKDVVRRGVEGFLRMHNAGIKG
jgi:hypothetical protein